MQITNLVKNINYFPFNKRKNKTSFGMKLQPMKQDTVSFSRKNRNFCEIFLALKDEDYPSIGLANYIKTSLLDSTNTKNPLELHKEYYSKLSQCQNLEEAKEIYPEFSDVIDAKEIDLSKLNGRNVLIDIAKGKYEGLGIENLSLELLKKFYGENLAIKYKENYFNISNNSIRSLFEKLNIKAPKTYFELLKNVKQSLGSKELWENPEFKERKIQDTITRWQDPDFKEQQKAKSTQLWQDEEFRAKAMLGTQKYQRSEEAKAARLAQVEINKRRWQQEGFREKMSAQSKANWQDPEFRKKTTEANKRYCNTPEGKAMMSKKSKISWQNPERKQKASIKYKKLWQNPEYRKAQIEFYKANWENPEYRKNITEKSKANWENPEFRAKMEIVAKAKKEAFKRHPEIRKKMSEIAQDFPELGIIIRKRKGKEKLSNKETKRNAMFFKICNDTIPNLAATIAKTQKEILAEWGFYDADIDTLLELSEAIENGTI